MPGVKKSPVYGFTKHNSTIPRHPVNSHTSPFGSDDELDGIEQTFKPSSRTSSEPSMFKSTNPFNDDEMKHISSAQSYHPLSDRNMYNNKFCESGGPENQTAQELENYVVYKAKETTKTVNNYLKIAEDIREDATKTLVTLHQQREQITRSHMVASDIEHDLSQGEKILGSLGGIFSWTWNPKMTRPVTSPIIIIDDPVQRKDNHLEQRERLGLNSAFKKQSHTCTPPPEATDALKKVEVGNLKRDDALSDLI